MKVEFIKQTNSEQLVLFFSGWATSPELLGDLNPKDKDLAIVYDYRDFDFDNSLLNSYKEIKLIAWSMGVFASSKILGNNSYNIISSTAFNGTNFPIDNSKGISESIFNSTLDTLNQRNLEKFQLRITGSKIEYEKFKEKNRDREIEDLQNELREIKSQYIINPNEELIWDKAVIGKQDRIFLMENQINAFKDKTEIMIVEANHYDYKIIKDLINE